MSLINTGTFLYLHSALWSPNFTSIYLQGIDITLNSQIVPKVRLFAPTELKSY